VTDVAALESWQLNSEVGFDGRLPNRELELVRAPRFAWGLTTPVKKQAHYNGFFPSRGSVLPNYRRV